MLKLNRFRQSSSDLSLHRSVMICNTLRMLEKQLEQDGLKVNVSPNGIPFLSSVSSSIPVDILPSLQQQQPQTAQPNQPLLSDGDGPSTDFVPLSNQMPNTVTDVHSQYQSGFHENNSALPSATDPLVNGSNGDYDKYFTIECPSTSGRATPFIKCQSPDDCNSGNVTAILMYKWLQMMMVVVGIK
ncbi:hypothetical protein BLA29_010401 [Euroglyphus maynei]|uniref:SERTA domain-containing protein n=1 Tax=Euroglyphus maynei TaxID=6958 RepID=A0A1Y3BW11_EURMA|nr:hypothetical protein BLA29_010401 [Euroglyphus maynei]